jgi:hypothetical protein
MGDEAAIEFRRDLPQALVQYLHSLLADLLRNTDERGFGNPTGDARQSICVAVLIRA